MPAVFLWVILQHPMPGESVCTPGCLVSCPPPQSLVHRLSTICPGPLPQYCPSLGGWLSKTPTKQIRSEAGEEGGREGRGQGEGGGEGGRERNEERGGKGERGEGGEEGGVRESGKAGEGRRGREEATRGRQSGKAGGFLRPPPPS